MVSPNCKARGGNEATINSPTSGMIPSQGVNETIIINLEKEIHETGLAGFNGIGTAAWSPVSRSGR